MTEQSVQVHSEIGQAVEQAFSLVPGVQRLVGMESLHVEDNRLRMNVTLCPLYAQGTMEESTLIDSPDAVRESRVAGKWQTGIEVVRTVEQTLAASDINLHVQFTFADLGVILNSPTDEDRERLALHRNLYEQAAQEALEPLGVTWSFQSYSEMEVSFPQFISPSSDKLITGSRRDVVDALVREASESVPFDTTAMNRFNKKIRPIVTSMVNAFGIDLSRLFLLQYGTFDAVTSRPGDLNCYFERGELLLNVTNLFPHGNDPERSRVDIKV